MALSFAIKLTDQVSPDARKAAGSLQALQSQITAEGTALKSLENQMRALQRGSSVSLDIYKQLSGAITDQKNKLAGLTTEMIKSGGQGFAPAKANASALDSLLGQLAGQSSATSDALSALGVEGTAAAGAVGALALSGVAAVGALVAVAGAVR